VRILHISSEYPPQKIFGLGRYVAGLAREQAAQGHRVAVLTNSLGGVDRDLLDRGVHVHRTDFPPPPMPPTPAAPVMAFNIHLQQRARLLGRSSLGDPEIVVSHDWLTAVAGHRLARRFGVPHVWTVHDTVFGKRFGRIQETEDQIAYAIEGWATRSADFILVNSRAIGEEIASAYGAAGDRVGLLHPGVDPAEFQCSQGEARLRSFRSALAAEAKCLITFVGRLDVEKGIDTLINAFSIVRKRAPSLRLAIAGRGVLLGTIQGHLKKLGLERNVTLCGYLEGEVLRAFYRVSDIHVCPSHYEPFGLVALEAMIAGTPVVASDVGGLRDIVSSPKVGRAFPAGRPEVLADTLFELAASPLLRKRIGEAGRKHVLKTFTWSLLAQKSLDLYAKALGSRAVVAV
jgi:glycosyltransferase involved in cell wall biosynthesis